MRISDWSSDVCSSDLWPLFIADPGAPQAPAWQPGQILRLGSLGRLNEAKGYDVLMAALASLRDRGFKAPVPFEIAIAGDGGQGEAIAEAARHAGFEGCNLIGFVATPRAFLATLHLFSQN